MTTRAHLDYADWVYAVMPFKDDGTAARPMIYGTAFCLGPGVFITAGHVIEHLEHDGGNVGVVRSSDRGVGKAVSIRTEVLPFDVGVILVDAFGPSVVAWDREPKSLLHDVSAVGFPFAVNLEDEEFKITMRGFKGHVHTRTTLWSKPGTPVGYEISTLFPKGMSGAPVLNAKGEIPELKIVGMVLGNSDVTAFGETTRFGVALDIQELATVNSQIVGGTLGQLRDKVAAQKESITIDPSKPVLDWYR